MTVLFSLKFLQSLKSSNVELLDGRLFKGCLNTVAKPSSRLDLKRRPFYWLLALCCYGVSNWAI